MPSAQNSILKRRSLCDNCTVMKSVPDFRHRPFPSHIFHSHCHACTSMEERSDSPLCSFCRHLRISHLARCLKLKLPRLVVLNLGFLKGVRERSLNCRFCALIMSSVRVRFKIAGRVDAMEYTRLRMSIDAGRLEFSISQDTFDWACKNPIEKTNWSWSFLVNVLLRFHKPVKHDSPPRYEHLPGESVNWKQITRLIVSASGRKSHGSKKPLYPFPRIRVLDVVDGRVVNAPAKCAYLALSFVRGDAEMPPLSSSGVLDQNLLPATIQDAILVCKKLKFKYLWVDQLCISQNDDTELQEQIESVHSIYHHAVCTLVALDGEDAHSGLPGARSPHSPYEFQYETEYMRLLNDTSNLRDCIKQSTWYSRSWTLQEAMLSSRLLYFTERGIHFWDRIVSGSLECPMSQIRCYTHHDMIPPRREYQQVLEQYMERHLTVPGDILRAFTSALKVNYGDATHYGLPLKDIDQAIAWTPSTAAPRTNAQREGFPSWSWASHIGEIRHQESHAGLAFWAKPEPGCTASVCKPAAGAKWHANEGSQHLLSVHSVLCLAWQTGCIESPLPAETSISYATWHSVVQNLITKRQTTPISERWSAYNKYWHDAFEEYERTKVFSRKDWKIATSAPGRIMVRGQTAEFRLGTPNVSDLYLKRNALLIHCTDGKVAGWIQVPSYNQSRIPSSGIGEFLLLSIGTICDEIVELSPLVQLDELVFRDINNYYCPPSPLLGEYPSLEKSLTSEEERHLVVLNVMLIERTSEDKVARRLGIGQIYLRRWIEAGREFQTIILE